MVHESYNNFFCNGKTLSQYSASSKFSENDIFILSFDFISGILSIYHNGKKAGEISIKDYKIIIPAFSLSPKINKELEIVKYEFC